MKHTNRICVPVCVRHKAELLDAVERAAALGDIIEVRLDCLRESELDAAIRDLPDVTKQHNLLLTLRPQNQGGSTASDIPERYRLWSSISQVLGNQLESILVDLELDFVSELIERGRPLPEHLDWQRVICSYHDFAGVPIDFIELYERMARTPAKILKLAVKAETITDCLAVFRLLERARDEGREMVAVAMGTAGVVTRILAPARGAFLTYGALEADTATAPGQLTAGELQDLYRVKELNEQTTITGLIGLPVAHSLSPQMHNAALATHNANAVYIPFEVDDLDGFMRRMVKARTREIVWNLRGLSVTAPHKTAVMNYLDWIEPAAIEIGAVNTVVVEGNELHGYNTDASAAVAPLREMIELRNETVAVIGAGGAARAVLWSLQQQGAKAAIFARDTAKARAVAEKFGVDCRQLTDARDNIGHDASFKDFTVVINTTPLGTRGAHEQSSPVTSCQLRGAALAYDLVYNPTDTLFLREARAAGLKVLGGLPMLAEQAAQQFELWTGERPALEVMYRAAERRLGE